MAPVVEEDEVLFDERRRRRSSWAWVGLVAGLVVVVVLGVVGVRASMSGSDVPTPGPGSSTPAAGPVSSGSVIPAEYSAGSWERVLADWWAGSSSDEVVGEAAPGLARCASRIEGVATETVLGWGVAFPRTLEGAVAASANAVGYWLSLDFFRDETRAVLSGRILDVEEDGSAAGWARRFGVDGSGRSVDASGAVIPNSVAFAETHLVYGAYRIWHVDRDPVNGLTRVRLDWWGPYVVGPGSDADVSGVRVAFVLWSVSVEWSWGEGRWRAAVSFDSSVPEPPGGRQFVNQSFERRAVLLSAMGPGWCVPFDGVEARRPGVPLAQEL
ncbi:MAG: hypothetical protein LBJ44_11995 [Propionibacteriaceae bacterium]|nr:hypothetical protein [Propionibacteriaceae bacterium]